MVWTGSKRLYAAELLVVGAVLAAMHAMLVWLVPVRFGPALPEVLQGIGGLTGIALAGMGALLAVWSYRERSAGVGVAAATFVGLTVGALGVSTLLAIAAIPLLFGRSERAAAPR